MEENKKNEVKEFNYLPVLNFFSMTMWIIVLTLGCMIYLDNNSGFFLFIMIFSGVMAFLSLGLIFINLIKGG